jgi:hypothetical protein
MLKFIYSLATIVFTFSLLVTPSQVMASNALPASLIFTEVKVRADTSNIQDKDEFIELYNAGLVQLPLQNYVIEYFNVTNPLESQQPIQKFISEKVLAPGGHIVLAKQPTKITNSIPTPYSSLSDSGGRLRLVTIEGDVIDEIAWTNTASLATTSEDEPPIVYQCNTSNALCNANRTQSIHRQVNDDIYMLEAPSWQLGIASPVSDELLPVLDDVGEEPPDPEGEPGPVEVIPTVSPTCEGVVITELLPNADGSDTNKEFIELHNPTTEPISLLGCSLQISASSKTYQFEDTLLAPEAYATFTDQTTGLTMPNAAGGTVWLVDAQKELQEVVYIADLDEDQTWIYSEGGWQPSYAPTPGSPNIIQPDKPCAVDQVRNVVTGNCEKIISTAVATLTPCKVGQERNPETNRCRSVITASALAVCKTGQERNPETNRCRAVSGVSTLQPCEDGQERNPETNRCRKVTDPAATNLAKITDVASPNVSNGSKVWILLAAGSLIVGYAFYEWRQDIAVILNSLMSKLRR